MSIPKEIPIRSYTRPLFFDDKGMDAFNRIRISNPETLFTNQFQYGVNNLTMNFITEGAGTLTHLPNESSVQMSVGTEPGDHSVLQSVRYLHYQPGKSQLILMTAVMGETPPCCEKIVGYGDLKNGIFFVKKNGENYVRLRSSASGTTVDTDVPQSQWNIDKMMGAGPSGKTLNLEYSQVFTIDMQWLGVGRVRLGFSMDGVIYPVHEFLNDNRISLVYMTTANLPVRYEIKNIEGSSTPSTMKAICSTVVSEGGFSEEVGIPFSESNGDTLIPLAAGDTIPVLTIQPKLLFNGIENRVFIIPEEFTAISTSELVYFSLRYNADLTGGTFTDVNTERSSIEFSTNVTSATGGIEVDSVWASGTITGTGGNARSIADRAGGGLSRKLPISIRRVNGSTLPSNLKLVATNMGSGTTNVGGKFNWQEIY